MSKKKHAFTQNKLQYSQNHNIQQYKCRFCLKKDFMSHLILPCSCLTFAHSKCLLRHLNQRLKKNQKENRKSEHSVSTCQQCLSKYYVQKVQRYEVRCPCRKSMLKNGSFRCGIMMLSFLSIMIMGLLIGERIKGKSQQNVYSPVVALLSIILLVFYSIFLLGRSRVRIESYQIANQYIDALNIVYKDVDKNLKNKLETDSQIKFHTNYFITQNRFNKLQKIQNLHRTDLQGEQCY